MKVLIAGGGGIGGFLGGFLLRSGAAVDFLVRREEARKAVLAGGLRVESREGSFTVRPEGVYTELPAGYAADLLVVAVKGQATGAVLAKLGDAKFETVVSLQNGLDKYEILGEVFGPDRVLGMFTLSFATAAGDGVIKLEKLGPTYIGPIAGAREKQAEEIAGTFEAAGLPVVRTDDILSCEWSKKAHWIPVSMISAVAGCFFSRVFSSPDLRRLYLLSMREVAAVARSQGIPVRDVEDFEPLTLTGMSEEEALERLRMKGEALEKGPLGGYKQIMLQDLEAGRKTEMEETGGFVVRKARAAGVSAPLLDAMAAVIRYRENAAPASP
jgi:2-dehydropantoate 2-reductase